VPAPARLSVSPSPCCRYDSLRWRLSPSDKRWRSRFGKGRTRSADRRGFGAHRTSARKTCACGEGAPAGAWPQLGAKLTCQQRKRDDVQSVTCAPRPHVAFIGMQSQPRAPFAACCCDSTGISVHLRTTNVPTPSAACCTVEPNHAPSSEAHIRTSITRSGMAASRTSLGSATPSTVPPIPVRRRHRLHHIRRVLCDGLCRILFYAIPAARPMSTFRTVIPSIYITPSCRRL